MTKIIGVKEWTDVILLEDGDVLRGGEDGLANVQAKALTDRTNWLKENMSIGGNGGNGTSGGGLPIGSIIAFGGTKVPYGYLECNGALLSRAAYIQLYETIGTTWGFTSESDFKIPNFTEAERFLRSRSESLPVGTLQGDQLKTHQHIMSFGKMWGANDDKYTRLGTGSGIDISSQLTGGDETRPKSAVVMYCIKVLDSLIDPEQILASSVVSEMANKANRNEVKELAGTRLWVSEEYQPILNTPTIVNHGLNIDTKKCRCEVQLVCKAAEGGYLIGDTAIGAITGSLDSSIYITHGMTASLSSNFVQTNTGNSGIWCLNKSKGTRFTATLVNWRYIFRIWY